MYISKSSLQQHQKESKIKIKAFLPEEPDLTEEEKKQIWALIGRPRSDRFGRRRSEGLKGATDRKNKGLKGAEGLKGIIVSILDETGSILCLKEVSRSLWSALPQNSGSSCRGRLFKALSEPYRGGEQEERKPLALVFLLFMLLFKELYENVNRELRIGLIIGRLTSDMTSQAFKMHMPNLQETEVSEDKTAWVAQFLMSTADCWSYISAILSWTATAS
ncbi:hypothetical protein FNV43_RR10087 [Rhamnella rubrinervis]|uniref:Uncharacterized protein n=1 Tax=Rhamnella rubrinervis TaxID=2594499 RepID=A0A8K0MKE8_9ROSA|nr:hypothetical protein FNV43_RR10087 [Rhamnella rubrinervis]